MLPESPWILVELSSIAVDGAEGVQGGPFGSKLIRRDYTDSGVPVIRGSNLSRQRFSLDEMVFVSDAKADELKRHLAHPGDLVVTQRGTLGQVGIVPDRPFERYVVSQSQMKATLDSAIASTEFVYFFFQTKQALSQMMSDKVQTGVPHINLGSFRSMQIPLPPLPEQRAIAHVLRTVQQAREATEQVIAAARELKRSLMRHLFTCGPVAVQDADKVAILETDVGPIRSDWSISSIEEISLVKGGKRLPKGHAFASEVTPYPYVRVVDFADGTVDLSDIRFLTEEDHEQLARYTISSDDVYISIAGTTGLVGRVPEELDDAHLTENAAKLVVTDSAVTSDYLWRVMDSAIGKRQVAEKTTKSTQPKLALSRIRTIEIPLPDPATQSEITSILDAQDRKLSAEAQRRDALDSLFSSLLSELMSGRLRVPESMWEPAA